MGLAAPQVGILKQIVVIDVGEGPIVLINPEIVETSGEQTGEEGCLSVPGKWGIVTRPNYVKVRALNENMEEFEIEGEELLARAFCHEIDHLGGHLYVEKVEGELHDSPTLQRGRYGIRSGGIIDENNFHGNTGLLRGNTGGTGGSRT